MSVKPDRPPILVPVDFSEHAEAALLEACELAACTAQPLIILHVVHDPAEMPGYYGQVAQEHGLVRIQDLARETLDEFLQSVLARHPGQSLLRNAERRLVVGLPVTRILEQIEKSGASMVVMGSQGRTGLDHLMLGSKAEQVVRLSPVPVMIVKKTRDDEERGHR